MIGQRAMSTRQAVTFIAVSLLVTVLVLGLWPARDGAAFGEETLSGDSRSTSRPTTIGDATANKIGSGFSQRRYAEFEAGP